MCTSNGREAPVGTQSSPLSGHSCDAHQSETNLEPSQVTLDQIGGKLWGHVLLGVLQQLPKLSSQAEGERPGTRMLWETKQTSSLSSCFILLCGALFRDVKFLSQSYT